MNKLDMKLDRRESQYRHKIFQGRNRGFRQRQDRYRSRDRSHSREHGRYNSNRGRRNYNNNYNDRNYRSNYGDNSRSKNISNYGDGYRRNDRYDSRPNYRRDNFRHQGPDIGAIQGTIQEIGTIETKAEVEIEDKGPGLFQEIGKGDQGLDHVPMLAQTRIGPGVIDAMNMITLLGKALML